MFSNQISLATARHRIRVHSAAEFVGLRLSFSLKLEVSHCQQLYCGSAEFL